MRNCIILIIAAALMLALLVPASHAAEIGFTDNFLMDKSDLYSTGSNPYFILEPGYQLFFKSPDGDLTITVLNETKMVDGIETRIVEERETEGGELVEVSRNYFAISKRNNSVFYFGEEVDMYENGKVTGHGGGWLAGVDGARAGIAIPGIALLGARYYQEVAPKVAMDRAEIVSVSDTRKVPAGEFKNVLKTEETTPLESGKEYKYYAPGVGLIKDSDMELVRFGNVK